MDHHSDQDRPISLEEILQAANEAGGFRATVLASNDGLLVAAASARYDNDVMSAVVALLQKVGSETQQQLGLTEMDEIGIRSRDHTRLVCRRLSVGKESLNLVVIVPPGGCYRRVTTWTIRQIERLLS